MLNSTYRSNLLRGDSSSKFYRLTISPAVEARAIERFRPEELEEARKVRSLVLPAEVLSAGPAIVAHEFQPVDIVGGDLVDYFLMDNGSLLLGRIFSAVHEFTDVIRQHHDMAFVIFHLAT